MNKNTQNKYIKLLLLKLKFATSSLVATTIDYLVYLSLVNNLFNPVYSNIISYSLGIVVNFFMQKKFIFETRRDIKHVFLISVSFSILGLAISTSLIWLFNHNLFLSENQYITKLLVTGIVFLYNFYTKRFAFEASGSGRPSRAEST